MLRTCGHTHGNRYGVTRTCASPSSVAPVGKMVRASKSAVPNWQLARYVIARGRTVSARYRAMVNAWQRNGPRHLGCTASKVFGALTLIAPTESVPHMQFTLTRLFDRYFWLVGMCAVALATWFAAQAVNHIVDGMFLTEDAAPPEQPQVPPPAPPPRALHSKDGSGLVARNMFCSDCAPPAAAVPLANAATALPLVLVATNVSDDARYSFATIYRNNDAANQGGYYVGDKLPGAGAVLRIHYRYIEFDHDGTTERLYLLGESPAAPMPAATLATQIAPTLATSGSKDEMTAALDNGIRKISDTQYEIDKALVDKVLGNPMAVMRGGRAMPHFVDGKPAGIRMLALRPDSAFAKLGLGNGDIIQSINGFELGSIDKGLEIYQKLREATSLQMQVMRRGKPVEMNYTIR